MTSLYLTAYNLAAAIGWALVLRTVFISYQAKHTPTVLWSHVGDLLVLVQTSAALEMVHSLLRLVRSPFMGTFMQVMSRLFLIHVVTLRSTEAQAHWSLYLMIVSWSLVEIPRYLFYTLALHLDAANIPSLLFKLRYSLFMILYPSGITGEMIQMLIGAAALSSGTAEGFHVLGMPMVTVRIFFFGSKSTIYSRVVYFFFFVLSSPCSVSSPGQTTFSYRLVSFTVMGYLVGGPYMWMNMYGQRKRMFFFSILFILQ